MGEGRERAGRGQGEGREGTGKAHERHREGTGKVQGRYREGTGKVQGRGREGAGKGQGGQVLSRPEIRPEILYCTFQRNLSPQLHKEVRGLQVLMRKNLEGVFATCQLVLFAVSDIYSYNPVMCVRAVLSLRSVYIFERKRAKPPLDLILFGGGLYCS